MPQVSEGLLSGLKCWQALNSKKNDYMNLILDATGGMAGDMFAAALISAGANEKEMIKAMMMAANKIGESSIKAVKTHDEATRLLMTMNHNHGHLAASKARVLLNMLLDALKIDGAYLHFANEVLEVLIKGEKQAHIENTFLTDHHHHSHEHSHDDLEGHHHGHSHHHHHHEEQEEAWLHEAQDIIIDIIGAAKGLQLLNAPVKASLAAPVSLGGGRIKFSHGEMEAPAPATKIIIEKHNIPSHSGPIDVELCTPTGSAILAALKATSVHTPNQDEKLLAKGYSRGGKDLDIPPLCIYLVQ
jgi:uncharacterized protein (DUF111 family)